ncbi:MAG: glycosyltransferase family 4 protein [Flavisolibacter sp.]|nr:glycosyltransferase family 4 protein [Flavisolibacter sp.]
MDAFEKNRTSLWAEKFSLRPYHSLIGVSNCVINDYLQWVPFKGRTFVLYNFLPDIYFQQKHKRNDKTDALRCVAVGNLKELKNYAFLLEAFKKLKSENISLDIYGTGELTESIQSSIAAYGLPVRLCGISDDTSITLPDYDLFIQASLHEGYGLAVMEAMAVGLPVMLSDIPAFREITNGSAYFFGLDSVTPFVEKIIELKRCPSARYKFITTSIEIAEKNASKDNYLNNLRRIYSEVTSAKFQFG